MLIIWAFIKHLFSEMNAFILAQNQYFTNSKTKFSQEKRRICFSVKHHSRQIFPLFLVLFPVYHCYDSSDPWTGCGGWPLPGEGLNSKWRARPEKWNKEDGKIFLSIWLVLLFLSCVMKIYSKWIISVPYKIFLWQWSPHCITFDRKEIVQNFQGSPH